MDPCNNINVYIPGGSNGIGLAAAVKSFGPPDVPGRGRTFDRFAFFGFSGPERAGMKRFGVRVMVRETVRSMAG